MIALLDLGLVVIDAELWKRDQASATRRADTIAEHAPFLSKYGQLRLLWSDEFYTGFPWNQQSCPPPLKDYCVVVQQVVEQLRGQGRLLALEDLPESLTDECIMVPDLLADCTSDVPDLHTCWRWLLSGAVFGEPRVEGALCLPTWPRLPPSREIEVRYAEKSARLPLILDADDWRAFIGRHYRPDLGDFRVTVLVGDLNRAAFERARQELAAYGLRDCRRLPSLYEQRRTKAQTVERLQGVDLLVVCTNRIKHADTDHLDSEQITCPISYIDQDSEAAIVTAILAHFRKAALAG